MGARAAGAFLVFLFRAGLDVASAWGMGSGADLLFGAEPSPRLASKALVELALFLTVSQVRELTPANLSSTCTELHSNAGSDRQIS